MLHKYAGQAVAGGLVIGYPLCMKIRIKHIRKARGMTQEALAEASGVTQATISRLERNVANGSLVGLERIASVLKVSVLDLFEPEGMDASVLAAADALASLSEADRAAVLAVVRSLQRG
jgi:transcriptional regulator with XRE-family HTH domain